VGARPDVSLPPGAGARLDLSFAGRGRKAGFRFRHLPEGSIFDDAPVEHASLEELEGLAGNHVTKLYTGQAAHRRCAEWGWPWRRCSGAAALGWPS
jgi:hypothetical protein